MNSPPFASLSSMNPSTVREAVPADLDSLEQLETTCFPAHRQSSRRSIKNSIASSHQLVLVVDAGDSTGAPALAGSAVVILHKRSLRIYSIAVHPDCRRLGFGEQLIHQIITYGNVNGYARVTLEADERNTRLVQWYKKFGFSPTHSLPDYYQPGESACRMVLHLSPHAPAGDKIIIVTDDENHIGLHAQGAIFCSARDYLSNGSYSRSNRFHVLNLCQSYKTHSTGYYVSLLAAARNHRITPSVMSVKDLSSVTIAQSLLEEINDFVQDRLHSVTSETVELSVVFGQTPEKKYSDLGKKLYSLFQVPFFTMVLEKKGIWRVKKIAALNLAQVADRFPDLLARALRKFCEKKRYSRTRLKKFTYDLAILVNPEETTPPSCPAALEKFRKMAEKIGFFTEFITKADQRRLSEFDALFIRETTAIENHTYALARRAYTEGLVVVDDPWSILLCSNKVYLHERLANAGVRQPRGWLLNRSICQDDFLSTLPLPLVLKLPESSFSQGVFRVNTLTELKEKLKVVFAQSDLVIAQAFMVSDYDWRIGVMDNTPLFACKYYMARGHWQIYNWQSAAGGEFSGESEAIPIPHVPAEVIKTALRATGLIGNGLYGVDIKEVDRKAYVIEVNDNPNIDAGVEDLLLGNELYERIMQSMFNRIEAERSQPRYLT